MSSSGYDWDTERRENCEKIISHLKEHGTITAREAMDKYGIFGFQYYLKYLKKQGYKLSATEVRWKNQQGETVVGYVYRLSASANAIDERKRVL